MGDVRRWRRGRVAAVVALGYLALVAGAYVFVAVVEATWTAPDASFAGVVLYFVTMPLSLVAVWLVPEVAAETAVVLVVPAVCGVLQAIGLWLALRGRRVGRDGTEARSTASR